MTAAATGASPSGTTASPGKVGPGPHWLAIALPVVVLAIAAAVVVDAGRGTTFFFDEWIWIMQRRSPGATSLLEPFNNHLMALPIATYQLLFRVFGLDSQAPYRLLLLAGHLATCGLLYVYLRRRLGWVVALGGAAALAFFGYTWAVIIWPISLGWVYATTAGIAALLLLDRDTRRSDIGACAALLIGVLSSGIAVPFVLGMTVELGMRRTWRRIYVALVPLVVFGTWYLAYSTGTNDRGSVGQILEFAENVLAQTVGTLLGVDDRGTAAHVVFAVVVVAVIALWFVLGRPHSPRFVGLVTALVAFTALLSYSRATSGLTTWHSYAAAVFVLLVLGELLKGRSLGAIATVAISAVVVWSIVWNIGQLHDGSDLQRFRADQMRAQLTAVDLAGPLMDPDYRPGPLFLETHAGPYLEVAEQYGTPAYTVEELQDAPAHARQAADVALVEGIGIELEPATPIAGASCAAIPRSGGLESGDARVTITARSKPVSVFVGLADPDGGGRRGAKVGRLGAGDTARLALPALPDGISWLLSFDDPTAICLT
ncbi:MAG: hypothetical protein WEC34_08815 [Acidimicrobiia bacterium]